MIVDPVSGCNHAVLSAPVGVADRRLDRRLVLWLRLLRSSRSSAQRRDETRRGTTRRGYDVDVDVDADGGEHVAAQNVHNWRQFTIELCGAWYECM